MECRICYDTTSPEKLISPCNCSGSMKYIHKSCLDKCILYNKSDICSICNQPYQISDSKILLYIINSNFATSILTLILYSLVSIFSIHYNITTNTIFISYCLLLFGIHYIQYMFNYYHLNLDSIFENMIIFTQQPSAYTSQLCYLFYTTWIIVDNLKQHFLMKYI